MARTYRHLDLDQRRIVSRLVEARTPVGEIAARLGRHPSTIHRELGRNRFRDGDRGFRGYFLLNAHDSCSPYRRDKAAVSQPSASASVPRSRSLWAVPPRGAGSYGSTGRPSPRAERRPVAASSW